LVNATPSLYDGLDAIKPKDIEGRTFRNKLHGCAQGGVIVGCATKTAGDAEDANGFAHFIFSLRVDRFRLAIAGVRLRNLQQNANAIPASWRYETTSP
jgi:hypothetical protein